MAQATPAAGSLPATHALSIVIIEELLHEHANSLALIMNWIDGAKPGDRLISAMLSELVMHAPELLNRIIKHGTDLPMAEVQKMGWIAKSLTFGLILNATMASVTRSEAERVMRQEILPEIAEQRGIDLNG